MKVKFKRNLGRLVKSENHDKTSNTMVLSIVKWDKVFKNGTKKYNFWKTVLKGYGLLSTKGVFYKFYLVYS